MKAFSIRGAWSLGYEALAPRLSVHLLILAILGIAAPLLMDIMLREASVANASLIGSRAVETASERLLALFGLAFGYALQSGSYFASWRISFGGGQPTVAAIAYGIMMGLLVAGLGLVANFIGNGAMGRLLDSPQMAYLGLIAFSLPLALLFALFYTVTAVMMAGVVVVLFVLLVVSYGAGGGSGGGSPASLFAGAPGGLLFLALLLSALTIWLSARLSCVTVLLAEQGGFNLPAAIGESWRRTAAQQWAIARHLALIGGGLAILFVGASYLLGGVATFVRPGGIVAHSRGLTILIHLAVGLPLALLTVLVPLGIYHQVEGRNPTADVFE
jgi:hypothetical protein